jgi:hypothetical protein
MSKKSGRKRVSNKSARQPVTGGRVELPAYRNGKVVTTVSIPETDYKWARHLNIVLDDDDEPRIGTKDGAHLLLVAIANGIGILGSFGATLGDCFFTAKLNQAGYAVTAKESQVVATHQRTGKTFAVRYAGNINAALNELARQCGLGPLLDRFIAGVDAGIDPGDREAQ